MTRDTLLVLPEDSPLSPPEGVPLLRRPSSWGLSTSQTRRQLIRWGGRVVLEASRYRRVILITAGVELFLIAPLLRRTHVVAAD